MDTTLSGLLGTGRGSEVPTTAVAASLDFLSGASKGVRPDWSFNKAGSAKESREQEILTRSWHCRVWERCLKSVKAFLRGRSFVKLRRQQVAGSLLWQGLRESNIPSDTCILLFPFCLPSSELEDVVLDEDWHFLFMVMGTLQLSKYLQESQSHYSVKYSFICH